MSTAFQATRPLDPWRWLIAPSLICVGMTILFDMPLRIFRLQLPEPVFAMAPIFAWAMIRPSILPPFFALGLGLFLDLFWGGPLGLWGVSLLVAYVGVMATRSMMMGQSRVMLWSWYCSACLLASASAYLLTMLDSLAKPNLLAVFWQILATALLYPFAHRMIERFEDADVRFR